MRNFLLASLLLLPFQARADWSKMASTDFSLADYPRENSARWKDDFKQLHEYQDSRDEAQCALGRRQEHPTYEAIFMSKDSPLSREEADKAQGLVAKVMKLADRISTYHKGQFKRPRPYDVDDTLEPCAKKPGGAKSYPSSHSANAMAGACVLAELFPHSRQLILDYGASSGELRAVIGVHHPSDVQAGQKLGNEICRALLQDEEFLSELNALKH